MPRLFYLGPSTPKNHQGPSLQLFHVAHTTLFHPYDSVDFLKRRLGSISPRFLVYINSHCVDFREQAFDSISELTRREHIELPEARVVCKGHDGRNVCKPGHLYGKTVRPQCTIVSGLLHRCRFHVRLKPTRFRRALTVTNSHGGTVPSNTKWTSILCFLCCDLKCTQSDPKVISLINLTVILP